MKKDPKERIGYENIEEIKNHSWFKDVDWEKVIALELEPPLKIESNEDIEDEDTEGKIKSKWLGWGIRKGTRNNWKKWAWIPGILIIIEQFYCIKY